MNDKAMKQENEQKRSPTEMTNREIVEWLERYNNALTVTNQYRGELLTEVARRLQREDG